MGTVSISVLLSTVTAANTDGAAEFRCHVQKNRERSLKPRFPPINSLRDNKCTGIVHCYCLHSLIFPMSTLILFSQLGYALWTHYLNPFRITPTLLPSGTALSLKSVTTTNIPTTWNFLSSKSTASCLLQGFSHLLPFVWNVFLPQQPGQGP